MTAAVRCGVLGVGMIGTEHSRIIAASPGAVLVACCDVDPAAVARVPGGARFTTDVTELLDPELIEAVWICTPESLHRRHVEQALDAGVAVFCEKPIARTLADADAIARRLETSGGTLVVGHLLRFDPRYLAVHAAVSEGRVGTIATITARRNVPDFEGRLLFDRTTPALEMGVHDLDVMQWLAGPIERVHGEAARTGIVGEGAVDAIVATLRFSSGAVGTLELGWATPAETGLRSDYRLSVVGSSGGAFIELRDDGVAVFSKQGTTLPRSSSALLLEDQAFLRLVRGRQGWPLSVSDSRLALVAAIGIDRSIADGVPVVLSDVTS